MRLLNTVLFLVSFGSVSMAGIRDSYMCKAKVNKTIYRKSGRIENDVINMDRFTFNRERDRIVSTNSRGHFQGIPGSVFWLITRQITTQPKYFERFTTQDRVTKIEYEDGFFVYTSSSDDLVVVIVTECEIY